MAYILAWSFLKIKAKDMLNCIGILDFIVQFEVFIMVYSIIYKSNFMIKPKRAPWMHLSVRLLRNTKEKHKSVCLSVCTFLCSSEYMCFCCRGVRLLRGKSRTVFFIKVKRTIFTITKPIELTVVLRESIIIQKSNMQVPTYYISTFLI